MLFGFSLGTGLMTATSSVGFLVVAAAIVSSSGRLALLIAVSFAAARAVAPVAVASQRGGLTERSIAADHLAALSDRWIRPIEFLLLGSLAVVALAGS
jgi:hypothetical protein